MLVAVKEGRAAPDFTLTSDSGESVSLSQFKGSSVVLYFYPKDDTPGCTVEACEFTAGIEAFQQLDAVVLGCSPDTPTTHRTFIAKHGLRITLLSDSETTVLRRFAAWGTKTMYGRESEGVIRSTVLIDPAGRVAFHWPKVKAAGHADEVREKLASLRG